MTAAVACSVTDLGMTGWCSKGEHSRCAHRPGGPLQDGLWMPECTVRVGTSATKYADTHYARVPDGSVARVVRPSHLYRCPCPCHHGAEAGQLAMFAVAR